jgi:hypothetical protein
VPNTKTDATLALNRQIAKEQRQKPRLNEPQVLATTMMWSRVSWPGFSPD